MKKYMILIALSLSTMFLGACASTSASTEQRTITIPAAHNMAEKTKAPIVIKKHYKQHKKHTTATATKKPLGLSAASDTTQSTVPPQVANNTATPLAADTSRTASATK